MNRLYTEQKWVIWTMMVAIIALQDKKRKNDFPSYMYFKEEKLYFRCSP